MAYGIYLPQRWRKQPPSVRGLDSLNPLTNQLQAWQTGRIYAPTWTLTNAAPSPVADIYSGLSFTSANNSYLTRTTPAAVDGLTMLALVRVPASQNAFRYVLQWQTGTSNVASLYYNNSNNWLFESTSFVTFTSGAATSTTAIDNSFQLVIGRQTRASFRDIWINGIARATDTTNVPLSLTSARIGRISGGDGFTGRLYLAAFWARGLTDAEVVEVSENPWQLFRPANSPVFFSLPSAGAFTLALDAGSYSLTGQDPTLTSARSMALDAGAYSLTGNGVDFNVGRIIYLDAGTYAVTGHDPTLTSARSLALDAGAYSVTGNDVTLVYSAGTVAYSLTLDAGSYSITGLDPTLASNRNLSLDAGSYALTGNDVTFSSALSFPLDTGVYTLSGLPVGLVWSGAPVVEVTDRIITLRSLTERWRM